MSQYNNPYPNPYPNNPYPPGQQPGQGHAPYAPPVNYYGYPPGSAGPDPLAPAKRAGVLMAVLGGLMMLCGTCLVASSFASFDQLPPEQRAAFDQLEAQLNIPITTLLQITGGVMLVPGFLFVLVGVLVRRGGLGIVVTAIVLTSLALLFMLLQIVSMFLNPAALASGGGAVGVCMVIIPLALLILLMTWLVQAAKASRNVADAQSQYQAQYWQYQQQQQAYGGAGGYAQPQQQPQAPAGYGQPGGPGGYGQTGYNYPPQSYGPPPSQGQAPGAGRQDPNRDRGPDAGSPPNP